MRQLLLEAPMPPSRRQFESRANDNGPEGYLLSDDALLPTQDEIEFLPVDSGSEDNDRVVIIDL